MYIVAFDYFPATLSGLLTGLLTGFFLWRSRHLDCVFGTTSVCVALLLPVVFRVGMPALSAPLSILLLLQFPLFVLMGASGLMGGYYSVLGTIRVMQRTWHQLQWRHERHCPLPADSWGYESLAC